MSIIAVPTAPLRVSLGGTLRSEWTKFRSVRSSSYILVTALLLMIGLGALLSGIAGSASKFDTGSNAVSTSLIGTFFAQLAVGVLAVLMVSAEYSSGMIRTSLAVVPRRLPVLWAKLIVCAVVIFAITLLGAVISFVTGQLLLSGAGLDVPLSAPGAVRSIIGSALYLTVAGLTGVALGALLRNTAAAITLFVAVFFVLPPLTSLLPASMTETFVQYLPSNAGGVLLEGTYGLAHPLAPWTGFVVMCGYALVLVGLAGWRLREHDA